MTYPVANVTHLGVLAAFCSLAVTGGLAAQTISGMVTERGAGTPAEGVQVLLLPVDEDSSVASVLTDGQGRFRLPAPPGLWQLRADRIGHRSARSAPLRVDPGEDLFIELEVPVEPVALGVLEVTVRRRYRSPGVRGFYDRADRGVGRFVTAEQIEQRQPSRFNDILRSVPGLDIICGTASVLGTGCEVRFRRASSLDRACPVQYFLDGTPISKEVVETLEPAHVEGVEIYNGLSDVPPRFRRGRNTRCGVVAVWVKARP